MIAQYIPLIVSASGNERSMLVQDIAAKAGVSVRTVYRQLEKHGITSSRKRRADAGSTCVLDEDLQKLSSVLKTGVRNNDKHVMDIPTARQILEVSDGVTFGVDDSTLSRLLRERGLDLKSQQAPDPYVTMRSLYPNHVHQVDPSVCLIYYLPNGRQEIIEESEVYKNKPYMAGKENLKVWRYVLTDHFSGSIIHRYYQTPGENQLVLWDFLLYAWGVKNHPQFIMHGLPEILIWDKGSANTSKAIANALRSLRVTPIAHTTGNPRAKGSVERANSLVEKHFESRLRGEQVHSADELNEYAEKWNALYNANLIDRYDSKIKRAHKSRLDLWQTITIDQLRELPEEARGLLAGGIETRIVGGDLTISYVHPSIKESRSYNLGGLPGIRPKMTVNVQPILTEKGGLARVWYTWQGEEVVDEILPQEIDIAGFPLSAPVFGENFKRHPDTYVQTAAKQLNELIGDAKTPFSHWNDGQGLGSLSAIREEGGHNSIPMPLKGKPVDTRSRESIVKLSSIEAALILKNRMGFWDASCLQFLKDNFPGGVPESELETIEDVLKGGGIACEG